MSYRALWLVFLLAFSTGNSAFAQLLSVGAKVGLPLNDAYVKAGQGNIILSTASTDRYIIGPEVEVRLPFHLGIEADALYRHYTLNNSGVHEWDFPILLKYRFRGLPLIGPFADAGPIFNRVSNLSLATLHQSTAGVAIGGGLDFHALLLHVSPEFRYVHWANKNYGFGDFSSALSSNQNQLEFLVGVTF